MERLLVLAYRAGWAMVRALPERVAARLFERGADLAWRRQGKGTHRLRSNLARVVPERHESRSARPRRAAFVRALLAGVVPAAGAVARADRRPHAHPRGAQPARRPRGRAAARFSPCRTWVIGITQVPGWCSPGCPFTTVAERLKPEELYRHVRRLPRRSRLRGASPPPGAKRPPFEVLVERLRAGGMLCLLADRDLTPSGVPVTFFGARRHDARRSGRCWRCAPAPR